MNLKTNLALAIDQMADNEPVPPAIRDAYPELAYLFNELDQYRSDIAAEELIYYKDWIDE